MDKNNKTNKQEHVDEIINSAMKNLKDIIDSNTIIGKTIKVDEMSIIPISKVHVGFVAGGGENGGKNNKQQKALPFMGGSGAGFSVVPVGILSISKGKVEYLQIDKVDAVGELLKTANKVVSKIFKENKNDKGEKD